MAKLYRDKEWLTKELKVKSGKQVARELDVNEKTIYRWAKKFDISLTNNGNRKHTLNDSFFENVDNQFKAYWLGFITADGCVYSGSGNSRGDTYRLQINLAKKDKELLEKFNRCLRSDYPIKETKVNGHDVVQLKINSTKLCKDLIKLGVKPRKSQKEIVPDIDKNLLRHFFRGYFDGDGSIRKNSFRMIAGEEFLEEFADYMDIPCRIKTSTDSPAKFIAIYKNSQLRKIYDKLYSKASTYLVRKHNKFTKVLP